MNHTLLHRLALSLLLALTLHACGGGGGGGDNLVDDGGGTDDGGTDDGGTDDGDNDDGDTPAFSLRGTISAAGFSFIDSDTNDPNTTRVGNDTFATAQPLANPALVGGYANEPGTGPSGPARFPGDWYDVYQADLAAGQSLVLSIADPEGGDLDLHLYDADGQLLDSSLGVVNLESLTVPAAGRYYVVVEAFGGASNYVLSLGLSQTASQTLPASLRLSDEFVPGQLLVRFQDYATASKDSLREVGPNGLVYQRGEAGRSMLYGVKPSRQSATLAALSTPTGPADALAALDGDTRLKFDTLRAVKELRQRFDVRHADPNYLRRTALVPNDEHYPYQWHYPKINLPQAWDVTTGDSRVVVAVVDTGVMLSHPDLQGQLVAGYDFISDPAIANDGNGIDANPDDVGDETAAGRSSFHGTHVAGTIAAASNNGSGVAGVAWNARIMPVRVLGVGGGTTYDVEQGVRYAAGLANDSGTVPARRADIINLSLGGSASSQSEAALYQAVYEAGVIVVAAAGNESSALPSYPAAYPGVVSVSAVDINSALTDYSNYGASIDVAAPGGSTEAGVDVNGDGFDDGVLSTVGDDSSGTIRAAYKRYQGTSMAAPHMAGVVALMKSVHPDLTPVQLDELLTSGRITRDLGASGRDNSFGYGLIDAYAAVVAARELAGGAPLPEVPALSVNPRSLNFGSQLTTVTLQVDNGGNGTLTLDGITSSETWLTVTAAQVDDQGLGSYRVNLDRQALAEGTHTATLTVNSSAGSQQVTVIATQGGSLAGGDAGFHYVLLLSADGQEVVDQYDAAAVDSRYGFRFDDVPAGTYQIVAGSDLNNDGFICDAGEACGAYTTLSRPQDVVVEDADRNGLDFSTGYSTLEIVSQAADTPVERAYPLLRSRSGQ